MKILSYNIHKGFTAGNRQFVLHRMREVLEAADADLVFLQEVVGHHVRHAERWEDWPRESQFEFLADRLWPHHAYGKNAVYTGGHHGNAILSKHPIRSWENLDISTNRFEQRGMLHAVIDHPRCAEPLHVICLHLNLLEGGRRKQIASLCARIAAAVPATAPLVVAGDFNDWRQRTGRLVEEQLSLVEVHKHLHGACARSFPSWLPLLPLDRIYCRGLTPLTAECLTGDPYRSLSDHGALLVTVGF